MNWNRSSAPNLHYPSTLTEDLEQRVREPSHKRFSHARQSQNAAPNAKPRTLKAETVDLGCGFGFVGTCRRIRRRRQAAHQEGYEVRLAQSSGFKV